MEEGFIADASVGATLVARWIPGAPERDFWELVKARGKDVRKTMTYRCPSEDTLSPTRLSRPSSLRQFLDNLERGKKADLRKGAFVQRATHLVPMAEHLAPHFRLCRELRAIRTRMCPADRAFDPI
jgi:hypothetical protein